MDITINQLDHLPGGFMGDFLEAKFKLMTKFTYKKMRETNINSHVHKL